MNRIELGIGTLAVFLLPSLVAAQNTTSAGAQAIEFDHLNGQETVYRIHLRDGEEFEIIVQNACEAAFSYEVQGLPATGLGAGRPEGIVAPSLSTVRRRVPYNDSYGGYRVDITRRSGGRECDGSDTLEPKTLIVFTLKREWTLAFSGGFVVTGLTDPVYELDANSRVVKSDKHDQAELGQAAFTHFYNEHHAFPLVPMFGIGIRGSNQAEYYLGGGWRLGNKATINFGAVLGERSRLPVGVNEMQPVTDGNVLSDLPTKTGSSWFFGISYSFIDTRDLFRKPFAGS